FSVYPNPVAASLNVNNTTGIRSVSIVNVVGQEVLRVNNIHHNSATINTSDLEQGIYFINITDANGVVSSRKVIRK
ncbi:MAG: T9SS type A sorting domain-containing protein, partial [Bacteroidota bacterium]